MGNENFLTIGNFNSDQGTTTENLSNGSFFKDDFFISGVINHGPMKIIVRDVNGKIVSEWKKDLANGTNVFKLNVDNGMHFVHVLNPITNESSVEKLVINRTVESQSIHYSLLTKSKKLSPVVSSFLASIESEKKINY